MQDAKGFNPYKFGFGAASDSHNTGVAYRQDNFFGGHGADRRRRSRSACPGSSPPAWIRAPSGRPG